MLASLELSGKTPGGESATPAAPPLDASGLLTQDELKAVTGYGGSFAIERLADLPQTPIYDSKHFRADGKPESYDAAIRVWRLPNVLAAESRWRTRCVKRCRTPRRRATPADLLAKGYDRQILAVGVLERSKGLVVELTCGVDLCRDHAQAMALLRRVLGRAERLASEAPPAKEPAKPTAPEKPETEKPETEKPEGAEARRSEKKEEPPQQPEEDKRSSFKPPEATGMSRLRRVCPPRLPFLVAAGCSMKAATHAGFTERAALAATL